MVVNEVFRTYLYPDPLTGFPYDPDYELAEDITPGIVNVDITSGTEIYEGPYQQIDTGQFTIVTRNPNLDPKINSNLKYNSRIAFVDTRGYEFFRGYVTDVTVEYVRDDNPIITIIGTDIFGAMQRVVITQEIHDAIIALSTGPTWNGITFQEFTEFMAADFSSKYLDLDAFQNTEGSSYGFWFGSLGGFSQTEIGELAYSPAKYIPEVGETYLDVINQYAQTNLTYFEAKGDWDYRFINVYPFVKYDSNYWAPQIDPILKYTDYQFSSDPADGRPYEAIVIDNGYNKVTNQLDISNTYQFIDEGLQSQRDTFNYASDDSIDIYAVSKASLSTIFPNDNDLTISQMEDRYAQNIFQVVQFPAQEINQVTFNNARLQDVENEYTYSGYRIHDTIRIKYQINETETIDRIYDIAGINHNISPDKWEMTFIFKPSKEELVFNFQGEEPTLEMNAITGDTNFNFTASITNYDPENISEVVWALNSTEPDAIGLIYPTAVNGERFKDFLPRTGLTQTWNFDDDGILRPYTSAAPSNLYGNYGPGYYTVYAFVTLINGFIITLQQNITVGTPVVEADFTWSQNQINNFGQVTFTNTSVNHESGEPDSYLWDFGDGTTSSEQNPIHQYNPSNPSQTEYSVSLTVFAYGPGGTKVYDTKTTPITLTQPTITADFSSTTNLQTVTFVNLSTNVGFEEPDAYLWEFGDGTTSTLKDPIKTFPTPAEDAVTYNVKLTITDIWERTATVTKAVIVQGPNATGNFGVRYIRLRINTYTPEIGRNKVDTYRAITPIMNYFKGLTSGTNANLVYLKPIQDFNNAYQIQGGGTDPKLGKFRWLSAANDGVPLISQGSQYFLTRNPSGLPLIDYGLGALRWYNLDSVPYDPTYWELVIDLGTEIYMIKDMVANFRDMLNTNATTPFVTANFYPRIWVDVANTLGSLNNLPAGTIGTPIRDANWVNVGYFQINPGKMDPTQPANTRTEVTKTMVATRPMPLNIPYFTYTFNEKIVSFTSIETADSYLWTFGDGTTSTLKNPVKTYANYQTYTVTLQVTNGGVITRTTTEPVIVEQRKINQFPFRYVKFVQNEHTGTHPWDTPILKGAAAEYQNYQIAASNAYLVGTMTNTTEQFDVEFYRGAGNTAPLTFDPNTGTTADKQRLSRYTTDYIASGMRVKSLDAAYKTGWTTILDYGTTINNATNFRLWLSRSTSTNQGGWATGQTQPTVAAGISYSVYITDYVGSSIDPNAVTWTQVGTITPTGLPASDNFYMYNLDGINNLPG